MKKPILLTAVLLLLATVLIAQTIHRVNTNPTITGLNVHHTLQAAHDAADPGDIIIVEASSISCGNLVATKGLKIYGKGYFTGANPDLHISPDPSLAGDISFDAGSDNSEISGMTCVDLNVKGASNIRIYRNHITTYLTIDAQSIAGTDLPVSNIQVSQNYVDNSTYIYSTTAGVSNVSVTNNHLYYVTNSNTNIAALVINNNNIGNYVTLNNATFQDNIIYSTSTNSTFAGCSITNNVARGNETDLNAGTNNLINNTDITSATTGFVVNIGAGLPAGVSEDERWQLQAASPLKTASTSGEEVGMYGGLNPYVPSGIPGAPSIIKLITPDYGNTAAPLSVTISVKSNN